jgi:hypothetical protein
MTDKIKTGIKEVELEMVIRDKDGKLKSIDKEVKKLGNTR